MKKIIFIFFVLILLGDFTYSFLQYYHTPLDGDMAGGILPTEEVQEIFDDPFGFGILMNDKMHPNPNRFFAHLFFRDYFQNIPLLFQKITTPIDSVYYSCAVLKLVLQIMITYFLSLMISGSGSLFNIRLITVAVLLTPLFQAYGYGSYMGIIDQSITYTFFYGLPLMLLLVFFSQFYTFNHEKKRLNPISKIGLILLTIVLPFSGPLIPAIILITALLLFIFYLKKYYKKDKASHVLKNIFKNVPKDILMFFIPVCLLSMYSLFLGTYNSTYQTGLIPVTERYLRLPSGIYYQFTQKLGFPLLFVFIGVNMFIIRKKFFDKKGKKIISSLKWIALFAFIYILLLPLGGYRPYRSNILRFDTVMPITICLFYIYGLSTLFLLENITKRKSMYYAAIITFSLIFTYADHSTLNENECEKQALMTIANSEDQIVPIESNCNVISWEPITDSKKSKLNAELLRIWNITDETKLYYNKSATNKSKPQ